MPYVRCDASPRHSGRVGHSGGAPIVRRGATFARSDTVRKPNFFAVLRVTKKPLTSTAGAAALTVMPVPCNLATSAAWVLALFAVGVPPR